MSLHQMKKIKIPAKKTFIFGIFTTSPFLGKILLKRQKTHTVSLISLKILVAASVGLFEQRIGLPTTT